jgi:hypothetical protein
MSLHHEPQFRVENQTAAAGGRTEMSDGCSRLALCACEENYPRPGGPCGSAGRVAFIRPVMIAIGWLIVIVVKLCQDWPQ